MPIPHTCSISCSFFRSQNGRTPLIAASAAGVTAVVRRLLESKRVNVNQQESDPLVSPINKRFMSSLLLLSAHTCHVQVWCVCMTCITATACLLICKRVFGVHFLLRGNCRRHARPCITRPEHRTLKLLECLSARVQISNQEAR